MGGGLMQLVAYGAQDIYLTGNPQITFFKVVYRRHTNFSMEAIQQTWNGFSAGSDGRCTATISRNGDLVHRMYFQVDMGQANASFASNNPGAAWITNVAVEIGGQTIDKHYGSWLETWAELTEPNSTGIAAGRNQVSKSAAFTSADVITTATNVAELNYQNTLFQRMAGYGGVQACSGSGVFQNSTASGNMINSGKYLYVPLQFWFCKNPGLALPLIALQYHEVKIILEHKIQTVFAGKHGTDDPSNKPTQSLWADYIYLDTDERRRFAQVSHEYLIEQLQYQESKGNNIDLNFNHPVKELIWTGRWNKPTGTMTSAIGGTQIAGRDGTSDSLMRYADSEADPKYLLKLNGHDRFAARPVTYFTQTQVWEHHTGPGGLNVLHYEQANQAGGWFNASVSNAFDDSIAVYSFALKPEEHQPSGTCNFSRIDSAQLIRAGGTDSPTDTYYEIYAINYNVLRIMSGMGGLAYSN